MLYRIDTDSKETLVEIMQKLNTTQAGFMLYWYRFDYYEKGKCEATMNSEGWFIDLDDKQFDLGVFASTLSDYCVMINDTWSEAHEKYSTLSAEDDEYFNAVPLYITSKKDKKI